MDNQKTGTLIARRRTELGLTQKQLAEQLHLSDRTISRWERGVGFPEISLLEPLADALGLSVLELLRGERMEPPPQDVETTIRDAAQTFGTNFKTTIKRLRWIFAALAVLLAVALFLFSHLLSRGLLEPIYYPKEVTAAEALEACPFVLITTEEYDFLRQLRQDQDISAYITKTAAEGSLLTDYEFKQIEEDVLARYSGVLTINGSPASIFDSMITDYGSISIGYRSGDYLCYLNYSFNGTIRKTCAKYGERDGVPDILLENNDNVEFSIMTETPRIMYDLSS